MNDPKWELISTFKAAPRDVPGFGFAAGGFSSGPFSALGVAPGPKDDRWTNINTNTPVVPQ
jgi:hypothetical protein